MTNLELAGGIDMMRKLLGIPALVGALLTGPAQGADIFQPVEALPPSVVAPVPFNWTGLYIGLHLGGGTGTKKWDDLFFAFGLGVEHPGANYGIDGFLGGAQVGYNFQWDSIVLGAEAQGSFANLKGSQDCTGIVAAFLPRALACHSKVDAVGSIAGRIGGAFDRTLVYAKGGAGFVKEKHTLDLSIIEDSIPPTLVVLSASSSETRWGPMFGAGVEHAFTDAISAKLEYNYMHFGSKKHDFTFEGDSETLHSRIRQNVHLVKFGMNYRFLTGP